MLSIDPEIRKEFEKTLPVDVTPIQGQDGKTRDFTTSFFHMTPTVAALTILSKFQNNVKNAENQVTTYIHNQIGAVKVIYDQFAALVGQSSNYVMPGQDVEITAGVGAFSAAAKPTITIGGAPAALQPDGRAVYKFQASGAGNKSVPVTVTYTKPDGTKESKSFNVEYTVGTPSGAAVMLDKMNVFYIGVDNPVTISSGTGWDKTTVSMSGGTLTGSGSNRTVRVSSVGGASITVTADGKSNKFDFRVKRIPDPIIKVGPSSGGRIQSVVFKNQGFVRADLENFDFAANFSVVSATVYFAGAGFQTGGGVQTASISGGNLSSLSGLMQRCVPGSTVIFDNVKVQGPDGVVRTIQNPPGFQLF
jgi:gliding motility-associated protein GldM